jgi:hypothetical protein
MLQGGLVELSNANTVTPPTQQPEGSVPPCLHAAVCMPSQIYNSL